MCARCGEYLFLKIVLPQRFGWHAIPRIPIEQGGSRKAENCVIVCPKCYDEIGQDNTKVIPYSALPHFEEYSEV
jgi:hypothetical protein